MRRQGRGQLYMCDVHVVNLQTPHVWSNAPSPRRMASSCVHPAAREQRRQARAAQRGLKVSMGVHRRLDPSTYSRRVCGHVQCGMSFDALTTISSLCGLFNVDAQCDVFRSGWLPKLWPDHQRHIFRGHVPGRSGADSRHIRYKFRRCVQFSW
jgi:hypothetical protein